MKFLESTLISAFSSALFLSASAFSPASAQLLSVTSPRTPLPTITLNPNLTWGARQTYALTGPQTHELFIEGLGINDYVDVLDTVQPFTIEREFRNTSNFTPLPADYFYSLEIRQMVFRSFNLGDNFISGWVAGPDNTHLLYAEDRVGPALNPGESFRAEFSDIDPTFDFNTLRDSRCGLYEAKLRVDSDSFVNESNEQDNEVRHYFFIPSRQLFNLKVKQVAALPLRAAGKTHTHTFEISGVGAAGPVIVDYMQFSTQGGMNIKLDTNPKPPKRGISINPAAAPAEIKMFATPLSQGASSASGKITVFSEDGCIIKQESAQVNYQPPGVVVPVGTFFPPLVPLFTNEGSTGLEQNGHSLINLQLQ
jgi:hypothetical protein